MSDRDLHILVTAILLADNWEQWRRLPEDERKLAPRVAMLILESADRLRMSTDREPR